MKFTLATIFLVLTCLMTFSDSSAGGQEAALRKSFDKYRNELYVYYKKGDTIHLKNNMLTMFEMPGYELVPKDQAFRRISSEGMLPLLGSALKDRAVFEGNCDGNGGVCFSVWSKINNSPMGFVFIKTESGWRWKEVRAQ